MKNEAFEKIRETSGVLVNSDQLEAERKKAEDLLVESGKAAERLALINLLSGNVGFSVFGSARFKEGSLEYEFYRNLAASIVMACRENISIITGGAFGVMGAAGKGAREIIDLRNLSNSEVLGIRVDLPFEETDNPDLTKLIEAVTFGTRLDLFWANSLGGVYMGEGGIGTNLEMAFMLQLLQVEHLPKDMPLIFHPRWQELLDTLDKICYTNRLDEGLTPTISKGDMNPIEFMDHHDDIAQLVQDWHMSLMRILEKVANTDKQLVYDEDAGFYIPAEDYKHALHVAVDDNDSLSRFRKKVANFTNY
ncbi:MAG: LOG family protein [Candidatus Gracilibacteria bacterium]|jgi:predicted Rossmann-fold nucleotide-binding protein|nr:LOG family protein [Candidatus Gracilibacteria bacterium]